MIFFFSLIIVVKAYLTVPQWKLINSIIINKQTPFEMRHKVNNIIFNNYYNETIYQSYLFKKKYDLLTHPFSKEIDHYAFIGLGKAIHNYNGKHNFYKYSKINIHYELIKSFSELINTNILPHSIKSNKKMIINKKKYDIHYKNEDILLFSKNENVNNLKDDIKEIINYLDEKLQIIFYLKYGNNLDKKYSNKSISEKLNCSEETIRIKLKYIYKKILMSHIINHNFHQQN